MGESINQATRKSDIDSQRRRRLAGVAAATAATVLAGAAVYEMNQPPKYSPDEIETGPVTILANAVLRDEPLVPDRLLADQGDADNSIQRDNLTLEGHSLKDQALNIKNMLIVTMPDGEKWGILEKVQEGLEPQKVFVQIREKGVEHPVINSFADIQPDGSAMTNDGKIIPPNDFQEVTFINTSPAPQNP